MGKEIKDIDWWAIKKPYKSEPSLFTSRRNLDRVIPRYRRYKDIPYFMLIGNSTHVLRILRRPIRNKPKVGTNALVELFYFQKRYDGKDELMFKEFKEIEILNVHHFKKYLERTDVI